MSEGECVEGALVGKKHPALAFGPGDLGQTFGPLKPVEQNQYGVSIRSRTVIVVQVTVVNGAVGKRIVPEIN